MVRPPSSFYVTWGGLTSKPRSFGVRARPTTGLQQRISRQTCRHCLTFCEPLPRRRWGRVKFYLNPKKLCKWVKNQGKGAHRLLQRACVLCHPGEEKNATPSWKQLYNSPNNWILRFNASVQARCPGTQAQTQAGSQTGRPSQPTTWLQQLTN